MIALVFSAIVLSAIGYLVFSNLTQNYFFELNIDPESIQINDQNSAVSLSVLLSQESQPIDSVISIVSNGSDTFEDQVDIFLSPSEVKTLTFSYGNLDEQSLETITLVPVSKGQEGKSVLGEFSKTYNIKTNKIDIVNTKNLVGGSSSISSILKNGGTIDSSSSQSVNTNSGDQSSGSSGGTSSSNNSQQPDNQSENNVVVNNSSGQVNNESISQNESINNQNNQTLTNQTNTNTESNTTTNVSVQTPSEEVIDKSLVLWMKADDDLSDSVAIDSSGNGNNLKCGVNCPVYSSSSGKNGGAYDFSAGDKELLYADSSESLKLGNNLTIAFWMKPSKINQSDQSIIVKGNLATNPRSYGVHLNRNQIDISYYNPWWNFFRTTNANIVANDWYHVVYTKEGGSEKIYINDIIVSEKNVTSTMLNLDRPLYIGWVANYEEYDGLLDDIRIYNKSLSASEVGNLYTGSSDVIPNTNISGETVLVIPVSKDTGLWAWPEFTGYAERGSTPTFDYRYDWRVGLYYFDLSAIPRNAVIKSAKIKLYSVGDSAYSNYFDMPGEVPIYTVMSLSPNDNVNWVEGSGVTYYSQYGGTSWIAKSDIRIEGANFYSRPTYAWSNRAGRVQDGDLSSAYSGNPVGYMSFVRDLGEQDSTDLATAVSAIVSNNYKYEGFAVDNYGYEDKVRKDAIATKEYADESKRPVLEVVYS